MAKYITATESARRLGVTDKTVRLWIKQGKLGAHHIAKNRLAILVSDVEALRRKRELYQSDEKQEVSLLVARMEELERKYVDLEGKYRELSSVVVEKDRSELVSPSSLGSVVSASVVKKRVTVASGSGPVDVPQGSMLFAEFGERYGVARGTFTHHVKVGIAGEVVETMKRPKPGRSDHTEYWLTPDQQVAVLAFWERHGVSYNK
jgi:excisionase family DNA binding protein